MKTTKDRERYLEHLKNNLLRNQIVGAVLLFVYCTVYGITGNMVLSSWQILYFTTSILFVLSTVYIKDKQIKNIKIRNCVIANQLVGTAMIAVYLLLYGFSSFAILSGFQLIFFMSSYVFAASVIYFHEKGVTQANEIVSFSTTTPFLASSGKRNLSQEELHNIVCGINNSLSVIVGFSELILKRDYKSNEKDYMIREIFEQAISISHSITKISTSVYSDQTTSSNEEPSHIIFSDFN